MAWKKVTREDTYEGSDAPYISVASHQFRFNAVFAKIAEIDLRSRVTLYIDDRERRIAFEFHTDQKPDSFALTPDGSPGRGKARKGLGCTSMGVLAKYPWVAAVSRQAMKNRRFTPKKEGSLWVIQLCPAFEIRKARESADIPADHAGIYRYLREDGEIVYIGRGPIKARLNSPEREMWTFDVVEYSVVDDPDQQVRWEDYWIERFKEDHNGEKPIYNKISGSSKHRNSDESQC